MLRQAGQDSLCLRLPGKVTSVTSCPSPTEPLSFYLVDCFLLICRPLQLRNSGLLSGLPALCASSKDSAKPALHPALLSNTGHVAPRPAVLEPT